MTAMRIIAYFHPSQDPYRIRSALQAAGWHQVAMRDGSLWRDGSRPEHGWPAVHAPLYPGIARAYSEIGAQAVDGVAGSGMPLPPAPREVAGLPAADVYAVVNPGRRLMDALALAPIPDGAKIICVNEAARRVACDWQLCNDGFSDARFHGIIGSPGRITRRQFATTIPTGEWFALEHVGIVDGTFSTTCALRVAAKFASRAVYLYGHDLMPGNGLDGMTGHWDGSQLANCAAEVAAEIGRIRAAGTRVVHVRFDGEKLIEDDGSAPAKPRRGRRPHGTA